jgi:hypothetical protein
VLKDPQPTNPVPCFGKRVPNGIPHARFDLYDPYVGLLFTAGLEVFQHYLTYYRYSADEEFLRRDAYGPATQWVSQERQQALSECRSPDALFQTKHDRY